MVAATLAMAVFGTLGGQCLETVRQTRVNRELIASPSSILVAFALLNNLNAFVFYAGPGGPSGAFHRITNWVSVMRSVCYIMQTTIGDGVLVRTS